MAAFIFPSSPSPNQIETNPATGVSYQWDASSSTWVVIGTTASDMFATDAELESEASIRSSADSDLSGRIGAVENDYTTTEEFNFLNSKINANTAAINDLPAPVTYQIQTDKILRAGDPAIELVDSEGYYSNVKFSGTGGISITSDQSSIIIDGSNIDTGSGDVNLTLLHQLNSVGIKVNGSIEQGVDIPSASRYQAGVFTSDDWRKLDSFNPASDYYTKEQIDNQFTLRGVGYKYLLSSTNGTPTIRDGEMHTNNRLAGQITQISLGPVDDNGKRRRDVLVGDTLELADVLTEMHYRYEITQILVDAWGVTYKGSETNQNDPLGIGYPFIVYLYPTHISSAQYYDKSQCNSLYLKKTEGTAQTLKSNVKYIGTMDHDDSLVNKSYIENNFLMTSQGVYQVCDRITKFTQTVDYDGPITSTKNIAHKGYVDSQIQGVLDTLGQAGYATVTYVNDEVDKMNLSLSTDLNAEPNIFYGDYTPTGAVKDGDLWFDSMNLRLNVYSQGAWINPDRNDGKDLEDRITALEVRLAQLEGN